MIESTRVRRGSLRIVSCLLALGLGMASAEAQTAVATRGGPEVQPFLGSWELVEWVATNQQGQVTHPYGENAQGQISYTVDGRMGAHLMRPPADPVDAPPQHLAYWGTFSVQASAGTVTHHVIGANARNWLGSDQVRQFRFDGSDTLILSLGQQRLTWRRAGAR